MSKHNILYRVCQYEEQDGYLSKTTICLYESSSKRKAEDFLYNYLKNNLDNSSVKRVFLETKAMTRASRKDHNRFEEDF